MIEGTLLTNCEELPLMTMERASGRDRGTVDSSVYVDIWDIIVRHASKRLLWSAFKTASRAVLAGPRNTASSNSHRTPTAATSINTAIRHPRFILFSANLCPMDVDVGTHGPGQGPRTAGASVVGIHPPLSRARPLPRGAGIRPALTLPRAEQTALHVPRSGQRQPPLSCCLARVGYPRHVERASARSAPQTDRFT